MANGDGSADEAAISEIFDKYILAVMNSFRYHTYCEVTFFVSIQNVEP